MSQRLIFLASLVATLTWTARLSATTYWVAPPPAGSDSNNGLSSNTPFATPQKAVAASLAPGDTIYLRGGIYSLNAKVSPGSSKQGALGNPIKFWAYPGEQPILDFDTMPESSDKALDMRRNYWHVRGITVMNAPDSGVFVGGLGVIIEGCVVHDCDNDGLVLGSTSVSATNALILNCDSYRNFQVISGGDNGDGFAAKAGCGTGNVFRGCRSWNNSDDGWDFYANTNNSVVLQNCWSFKNGYDLWGVGPGFTGNGNGFKLGGAGTRAKHYLTNCVAFCNRAKGFDHNHSLAGQTIVNCTSYSNSVNFSFYETPTAGSPLPNLLINDVAFTGTPFNLDPTTVQITNSWQGFTVAAADFASIDTSQATNARNADFSLPDLPMFHLAAGSDLIDRAANVGLPYNGSAPDLGAYEFSAAAPPRIITLVAPQWSGTGFQMQVDGLTGHGSIVVHSSTDLAAWLPIFTNPPLTGSLQFLDVSATNQTKRFYRAEEK